MLYFFFFTRLSHFVFPFSSLLCRASSFSFFLYFIYLIFSSIFFPLGISPRFTHIISHNTRKRVVYLRSSIPLWRDRARVQQKDIHCSIHCSDYLFFLFFFFVIFTTNLLNCERDYFSFFLLLCAAHYILCIWISSKQITEWEMKCRAKE